MRPNTTTTMVAVLGIGLGLSASVQAERYHVDPDGSGAGGLSWPTAFQTVQDALTCPELSPERKRCQDCFVEKCSLADELDD